MRLTYRILMVFGLSLALLLPLGMIRSTVADRQQHRAQAVEEVARSTAGAQTLAGPVLFVPYSDRITTYEENRRGERRPVIRVESGTWVFFPERLGAKGTMRSLPRMRGLHEVRVFELDTVLTARFAARIPADDDPSSPRTIGQPRLGIHIADVRGLVGVPTLRTDGTPRELVQGLGHGSMSGLHGLLPAPAQGAVLVVNAEFSGVLQGTETLSIVPLAGRNLIEVTSPWPHPQFHGDFLPRTRTIGADGFAAKWEVSSLASDAQARVLASVSGNAAAPQPDVVSVSLVDPVDVYRQVDRATKYGLLFVLLTFVAFFLFELFAQIRVHPIQYGLVGLAIAIFFLLLLALSEHIRFGLAYVAAATACIGLIWRYLSAVLASNARAAGLAGMLATLYAALYGLLVSEDNAMVLGAGLLFLILASIMLLTRKVDWYSAAAGPPAPARGPAG